MKKLMYLIVGGAMLILLGLCMFMFVIYNSGILEISNASKVLLGITPIISILVCVIAVKAACRQK